MRKKVTYQEWVAKLVENISGYFDLSGWTIYVEHLKTDEGDAGCYARISINSPYQHATLTYMPVALKDFNKGEITRLIMATVHELTHVFLDPFQDAMHPFLSISSTPDFMEKIEQQTQKLTMVFLKTLPKELIPPR